MKYRVFLLAIALLIGAFTSANAQAALTEAQCQVQPIERINCGFPGISPMDCYNKGCCYSTAIQDATWCFYARPDNECLD